MEQKKTVVILGDFFHEGVSTTATSLGYALERVTLYNRRPKTWRKHISRLAQLRESGHLAAVITYFPTPLLLYTCTEEFLAVWDELVTELEKNKSILFVFEDNLAGIFGIYDYSLGRTLTYQEAEEKLREAVLNIERPSYLENAKYEDLLDYGIRLHREIEKLVISMDLIREAESKNKEVEIFLHRLFAGKLEIAPFHRRSDVTIRVQEFLRDDIDKGVFLKLYISNNRYQAEQLADFLRMFEDYLRKVEHKTFTIDEQKTKHGIIYLFRTEQSVDLSLQDLENAFENADLFFQLCVSNPTDATKIVSTSGIGENEARRLVSKYAKDYQRMKLDAKHEWEGKRLLLKQRFESDLLEAHRKEDLLPAVFEMDQLKPFLTVNHPGPVTINIPSFSIQQNINRQDNIGQVIYGDVSFTNEDRRIFEIIEEHAETAEKTQLKSELLILKDDSSPSSLREVAKQRLIAFLHKATATLEQGVIDVGVKLLIAYLTKLILPG